MLNKKHISLICYSPHVHTLSFHWECYFLHLHWTKWLGVQSSYTDISPCETGSKIRQPWRILFLTVESIF